MRAPGLVVLSRTHWQRMAPASPASRCARTCAHGLSMSMMRLPGRSVSGRVAASRARSIPYRAMSSAAFAVSASASGGVTPSASAFASADWLNVDVMDNHLVPNLTLGLPVVESLLKHATLPLDCHLMITDPDRWAPAYAEAGARNVTIHAEAVRAPVRTLRAIRAAGARAGMALNPGTPVDHVTDLLPEVDMLLLMTVEPGFGGQPFLDMVLPKLRRARALIGGRDAAVWLQVDGGVGEETIERCAEAGADVFVAGSAVYGSDDPGQAVQALRAQAERATAHAAWVRQAG